MLSWFGLLRPRGVCICVRPSRGTCLWDTMRCPRSSGYFSLLSCPFNTTVAFSAFLQFVRCAYRTSTVVRILFCAIRPHPYSCTVFTGYYFVRSGNMSTCVLLGLCVSSAFDRVRSIALGGSCGFFALSAPSLYACRLRSESARRGDYRMRVTVFPGVFVARRATTG